MVWISCLCGGVVVCSTSTPPPTSMLSAWVKGRRKES